MGDSDFHFMEVLDGDRKKLSFKGREVARDVGVGVGAEV